MWVSEFEQNIPEANGIAKLRLAARASCAAGTITFWWTYLQYHQKLENYMNTVRPVHTGDIEAYATAIHLTTLQAQCSGKSCAVYAELNPAGTAPTSWTAFPSRWQNKHELGRALMNWLPDTIMSRRLGIGSPCMLHVMAVAML